MTRLRSRLVPALCVLAMAAGLGTAALAHPGVRERALDLADRLSGRIELDRADEPLLAAAIFVATNERRVEHGLPPLRHHPLLGAMAARHARRMAALSFYSHRDPYNPALADPEARGRRAGIENPLIAENIHDVLALRWPERTSHSYRSLAEAVVDEWMASDGHRANILDPRARQLGVGVAFYWRDGTWPFVKAVQDFQLVEDVELAAK